MANANVLTDFDKAKSRPYNEIINDLHKAIPENYITWKKKTSNMYLPTLSWDVAVKFFEKYATGWEYEIRKTEEIQNVLYITVRVFINATDGIFFRDGIGNERIPQSEDEDRKQYGDVSSNAEAQALKRAFAKFGLGLYLYDENHPDRPIHRGNNSNARNFPPAQQQRANTPPKLAQVEGTITDGQLKLITDISIKEDLPEMKWSMIASRNRVKTFNALSFEEAKGLIPRLQAEK